MSKKLFFFWRCILCFFFAWFLRIDTVLKIQWKCKPLKFVLTADSYRIIWSPSNYLSRNCYVLNVTRRRQHFSQGQYPGTWGSGCWGCSGEAAPASPPHLDKFDDRGNWPNGAGMRVNQKVSQRTPARPSVLGDVEGGRGGKGKGMRREGKLLVKGWNGWKKEEKKCRRGKERGKRSLKDSDRVAELRK